jgi:hypothetical protein
MAIAVGLFAAISLDQVAMAGVAVLAALIYNGFLEDRFGQLAWHGSDDLWRLLLVVTVSAWGLALGDGVRFVANLRGRSAPNFDRTEGDGDGKADDTDPAIDEMSRSAVPESADSQIPTWATDLASTEVVGWIGPRPIDARLTDAGRADTHPLASSESLAN